MRSPSRLRRAVMPAAALLAVVLTAGCTTRVDGAAVAAPDLSTPPTTPSKPETVPEGFDETPEVSLEPGEPGGTLRVAAYEPVAIHPADAVSGSDVLVAGNLFTGLTVVGPDAEVAPGVAESWESGSDCTKWTFKLKPGTKFHNGEAVTAKSFVDAWPLAAKGAGLGYQLDQIKGYPKLTGSGSGLEAVDDNTLSVTLRKADCEFPVRTAHPAFAPLPKAGLKSKAFKREPIGNGPFRMDGPWSSGRDIKLTRFDDYGAGEKAYLDSVVISTVGSPEEAITGFEGGQYDWARVSGPSLRSARDRLAPEGKWISKNVYGYSGLVPMVRQTPLKTAAARKAISMALDRQQLSEAGTGGALPPAKALVSSEFGDAHSAAACGGACVFDPTRAAALAKSGGLRKGTAITLSFPEGSESARWMEAAAEQLEDNLGLRVKLRPMPMPAYRDAETARNAGGLFRGGWLPDVATPGDMLRPLLATGSIRTGSNIGRYSSKKVDKLLDQAARAGDEAKRISLYQQAERQALATDMAVIPLFERREFRAADHTEFGNLRMDFYENPDLRVAFSR